MSEWYTYGMQLPLWPVRYILFCFCNIIDVCLYVILAAVVHCSSVFCPRVNRLWWWCCCCCCCCYFTISHKLAIEWFIDLVILIFVMFSLSLSLSCYMLNDFSLMSPMVVSSDWKFRQHCNLRSFFPSCKRIILNQLDSLSQFRYS